MMLVWFWCARCERAFYAKLPNGAVIDFETGDYEDAPETCPFDCESVARDIWLYWKFREVIDYPPWCDDQDNPLFGVRYPLDPTTEDVERIIKVHTFIWALNNGHRC